ncbi:MAG: ATP-binding protein [Prolixibacteraceae bacterium]
MYQIQRFSVHFFVLVLLLVLSSCSEQAKTINPKAVGGIIDLSNWDFDTNGTVKLNGEWEFYWNSFYYDSINLPQNRPAPSMLLVPGLWNKSKVDGTEIQGKGYASYRLKIKCNSKEELSIKYLNSATSCAIFIDGKLLYSAGKPGKTARSTIPSYQPAIISFTPENEFFELVLQVANFQHKKGGQWEPLLLGTKSQISKYLNHKIFIELLLIGSILFMAIFHLSIFFKHRYERPLFFFGIFALLIAFKFLVSGEFSIYMLHEFKWIYLVRIDYLSFYLAVLFFLFFIRSLYPNEILPWVSHTVIVTSILCSASVLVLPLYYFSYVMFYFQLFVVTGGLYAFYVLRLALRRKREGANYFIYGFLTLFACMVHDILNENEIIYSISLVPIGLSLFILFQSFILSLRIRNALISNTKLTSELKIQNNEYVYLNNKYKVQNENLIVAKEKAEESDRFKSAFLANISHEIRTPMNGIIGFANLLSEEELTEERRTIYLNILKERGHHLLGVINDIIDVSKIETGMIEIRNEVCNLNELVHELFSTYFQLTQSKGLKLTQMMALPDQQSVVLTDIQKLKQIMDNLISNAIKFTPNGTIQFGYQLAGDFLEFTVSDTGIGMTAEEMKIIFDRFNQANTTITHQYGGTGLGLSIVKAYVEKMGGQINASSTPGQGSSFTFTLPYHPQNKVISNKNSSTKEQDYSKILTVLLVEDDPANAFLMEEILEQIHPKILHATDGQQTIEYYQNNTDIDIVLMDIKLPDTNGYDLTKELKLIRGGVPIIAQTAYALKGDKEKAIEVGCIDHISKPINSKELIGKILKYTAKPSIV